MPPPEDPGISGPIRILVGLPRNLVTLLTKRVAAGERLHFLYSVPGPRGPHLELNDTNGMRVLEGYAELAPSYAEVTVLVLPYSHIPERVRQSTLVLAELGATVLEPHAGQGSWPAADGTKGPAFDFACVAAICEILGLTPIEGAEKEPASLVERERSTMLSMLRGLASHDKLGPNNHSHQDDLWKSRGHHLTKGDRKGLLAHLLKKRKILGRKRNQSLGGNGWVYWINDVKAACADFPELREVLTPISRSAD